MANNLWGGSLRSGLAANLPTIPDFPSETFGFYLATDTGILYYGQSGATGWVATSIRPQVTPIAKAADATLTIAELLARIVTATKASAVALTLPLGTLTDAGLNGGLTPVNSAFEWTVINLGSSSGAVTMTASTGHTYVGNAVVAINTSAVFRTVKTAASTFITYRVS